MAVAGAGTFDEVVAGECEGWHGEICPELMLGEEESLPEVDAVGDAAEPGERSDGECPSAEALRVERGGEEQRGEREGFGQEMALCRHAEDEYAESGERYKRSDAQE